MTTADWKSKYEKPTKTEQELETEAGKFTCDVYEISDDEGTKTTEYITEGLVVMRTIKAGRSTVTYLLTKHEMK